MNREHDDTWVPLAAVALVVAVAAGFLFVSGPLESRRPVGAGGLAPVPSGDQVALARLWQDPLHAIHLHWRQVLQQSYSDSTLTVSLSLLNPRGHPLLNAPLAPAMDLPPTINGLRAKRPTLRLLVMTPGTWYVEDRENRRRQRHAVSTALTTHGFIPESAEQLGYFVMPRPLSGPAVGLEQCARHYPPARCLALVGFERYRANALAGTPQQPSIDVLWLNSDDFSTLDQVAALLATLERSPRRSVLLGPYTSGALRSFARDVWDGQADFLHRLNTFPAKMSELLRVLRTGRDGPQLVRRDPEIDPSAIREQRRGLHVLSPWATAPLRLLLRDVFEETGKPVPETDADLRKALDVKSFRSVVARDDAVLQNILRELAARGACGQAKAPVAIVAEQDTDYGQILAAIIRDRSNGGGALAQCTFDSHAFGYLRGLDGELPAHYSAVGGADLSGDNAAMQSGYGGPLFAGVRRAEAAGVARLDYVRGLADDISQYWTRTPQGFRRVLGGGGRRGPIAIGVFGSDVYDKLLILEALRERMPGGVFFTTDLDARLADPANYQVARNLIVGSSYGLGTPDKRTRFRHSYEAALYHAITWAIRDELYGKGEVCPRLYEIGRTGAADISRHGSGCPPSGEMQDRASYLRSGTSPYLSALGGLVFLAPLFILAGVGQAMSRTLPDGHRRDAHRWVVGCAGLGSVVVGLVAWCLRVSEPALFFEGISSVPAFVMQMTSVMFAVSFWKIANGRTLQNCARIEGELGLAFTDVSRTRSGEREGSLEEVWGRYVRRSKATNWRVAVRTGVGAGIILGVVFLEIEAYLLTRDFYAWLRGGVVVMTVAVLWTVFFCLDILRGMREFIRAVTEKCRMPGSGDFIEQRRQKMSLVVACTETVGPIMALPFVLLLLPVAAANTLSEGWYLPWRLIVVYGGFTVYVLASALQLQFEAVRGKANLIGQLEDYRHEMRDDAGQRDRLELVVAEIAAIRKGAFVPWSRHPMLQSVGATALAVITLLAALL